MKRFAFGMQRVLDYRRTLEDVLLGELGAIQAEYARESKRLDEMTTAREEFKNRMRELLATAGPDELKRAHDYLHDLTQRTLAQRANLLTVSKRKDQKTAEVVVAAKDRKSLERLREHKVEEHRNESLRDEQKFLDEVSSVRHGRAKAA
jgi:flagellar protein FliJ